MRADILAQLLAARASGTPVALVTDIDADRQSLFLDGRLSGTVDLDAAALDAVRQAVEQDRSGLVEQPGRRVFVHVFNPPERLIVVGAVHIAQALAPMASLAGYDVTIVDPRRAFATDARFPEVRMIDEWPDEALARLKPDGRTAIVTLTHDPKIDDPALAAALASPAFYVGALGSTRTHAKRLERLGARGFGERDFARIHGPIGLAIGARTPAEIAISIMAEITAVRRKGEARGGAEREAAA
jgi:xanthine dehydrogenase accessory factor